MKGVSTRTERARFARSANSVPQPSSAAADPGHQITCPGGRNHLIRTWIDTVEVDGAAPEVEDERGAPGPWRRGSSENRRLRLPSDNPRAPAYEQLELLQEPTRVGSSEKGERDRATTSEPPRERRVIRGRWKPAPRQVEEAVPVAGRTADRPDLAGRRRWCRFVEVRDGPVRMNEGDRRLAPRFDRGRGPRRSHDDGCTVARDRSRGMPGRPRLVRSQAEQHGNSQRIGEMLDGCPGWSYFNRCLGPERQLRDIGDLVDDRAVAVEAVPDQDAVVVLRDRPR